MSIFGAFPRQVAKTEEVFQERVSGWEVLIAVPDLGEV